MHTNDKLGYFQQKNVPQVPPAVRVSQFENHSTKLWMQAG